MRPHRNTQPGFSDEEIAKDVAEFMKRKKIEQVKPGAQAINASVAQPFVINPVAESKVKKKVIVNRRKS